MLRFYAAVLLFASFTLTTSAVTVSTTASQCTGNTGTATANVSGGTPPYIYAWSNGGTTNQITGLAPGTYSVTVTDALGAGSSGSGVVQGSLNDPSYTNPNVLVCPQGDEWYYDVQTDQLGGTPPYTSVPESWGGSGSLLFSGSMNNEWLVQVPILITDANGCSVSFQIDAYQLYRAALWQPTTTTPSCNGEANGTATLSIVCWNPGGSSYLTIYNSMDQPVYTSGALTVEQVPVIPNLLPGLYEARFINDIPSCGINNEVTSFYFTVADLGENCGTISGSLFVDYDGDCISDAAEPKIPYAMLSIQPGDGLTFTGADGRYSHNLHYGSYTLSHVSSQYVQVCPPVAPIPFTVNGTTRSVVRNIADSSLAGHDVAVYVSNGPARPGFVFSTWLNVANTSLYPSGDVSLLYLFDPALQFLSADPAPTGSSLGLLQWDLPALAAYGRTQVHVQFQVPADPLLIGTELAYMASVDNTATEANMTNNTVTGQVTVTGSFDPNDKLAQTSSGNSSVYINGQDEYLDYTIRFQNTGTDTAFTVVVRDTLPPELDLLSTVIIGSSHPMTADVRNPRALTFTFADILLPDSGTNEAASHGFVSFRIKPVDGLPPGSVIANQADIYFDFNPPVITEPSVITTALPGVYASVRMLLGGAAGEDTPSPMSDGLRSAGLLPSTEPYSTLGYTYVGTGAGASVQPAVLAVSGNNAIVDWVVVELRDAAQPDLVVASAPALLERDGDVVATNGGSPVYFNMTPGDYYLAVRHRNHLGVMTASPMALESAPKVVDFTISSTATYGTNARWNKNGTLVLWPGDVNRNGKVNYTGTDNDRDEVLVGIGGTAPTHVVNSVYSLDDVNMDGQLKYTGADNDRDLILQAIGGTLPTTVRTEQLP